MSRKWLLGQISKKHWLIPILFLVSHLFSHFSFHGLDSFIRDTLQFLNSKNSVNPIIKTVNIDKNTSGRPLKLKSLIETIDLLQKFKPHKIVILLEPRDFENNAELIKLFSEYVQESRNKNVLIGNSSSAPTLPGFGSTDFFKDSPQILNLPPAGADTDFGAQDKKWRRTLLRYNLNTEYNDLKDLKKLELNLVNETHFKYTYDLWNTRQIMFKTFRVGSFGHHSVSEINSQTDLTNKLILVGMFDEFSFLSKPSIFNLFNQMNSENFSNAYFPYQDYVAQIIHLWTTGDYIKYFKIHDTYLVSFFLALLLFLNLNIKLTTGLYLSTIPFILVLQVLLYSLFSIYVDFTRSISMLVFLQYFGIPIIMYVILTDQERKKQQAIADARIDALISISEQMAHDLKSPVSTIKLLTSKAQFTSQEVYALLNNSTERVEQIIQTILTSNRSLDNTSLILSKADISELVNDIIGEKKVLRPDIQFKLKIPINAEAVCHENELKRILSNIIDNSCESFKELDDSHTHCITIEVLHKRRETWLIISDNGPGIPAQILELIGTQRVSTKNNKKNSGIGLLSAKRLINLMNGSFSVDSTENGTTVSIKLNNTTP